MFVAGELAVGSAVSRLARHANSALLAVACDDLSIRMFDLEVCFRFRLQQSHSCCLDGSF